MLASAPTGPPPKMITREPGWTPAAVTFDRAQQNGSMSVARSVLISSGTVLGITGFALAGGGQAMLSGALYYMVGSLLATGALFLLIEPMNREDGGIAAMLAHDGPVIVDCRVAKLANCFPMIPSGAAHTDMILQANEVSGTMDDEAKALV